MSSCLLFLQERSLFVLVGAKGFTGRAFGQINELGPLIRFLKSKKQRQRQGGGWDKTKTAFGW